jgi:hypothetical protein
MNWPPCLPKGAILCDELLSTCESSDYVIFFPLFFYDRFLCVYSLEPKITVSVKEVGDLLSHIKGGGQVSLTQPSQRNAVSTEAEDSLKPLMDLLDGT